MNGPDDNIVGTVITRGTDVTVRGPATTTGAVPDAEFAKGRGIKTNAAGEAVPNGGAGGFGQILGGTLDRIRVAFDADIYRGS